MRAAGSTMDEGVLRLMRDCQARRAGDRLGLPDLLAPWRSTKLRHDDLLAALRRLQTAGDVQMEREAGWPSYRLTGQGEVRMRRIADATPGILFLVGMTAAAGEVPRRGSSAYAPVGRQRRKTDVRDFATLPEIGFSDAA
jgi:hypothetical protein